MSVSRFQQLLHVGGKLNTIVYFCCAVCSFLSSQLVAEGLKQRQVFLGGGGACLVFYLWEGATLNWSSFFALCTFTKMYAEQNTGRYLFVLVWPLTPQTAPQLICSGKTEYR